MTTLCGPGCIVMTLQTLPRFCPHRPLPRPYISGLDVDQKNKFGETPVVVAALHEATEMVLFLGDHGANMYAKSVDGYIPFQIAVRYGFPEMMKALYESGGGMGLVQSAV